jgi:Xaa-Pro aminopeptidase
MTTTVLERLAALREMMQREHLSAFVFPSTDPHQSEFVPSHWESRKWISGFDGSAGTAVVTLHHAALWTDSRYFLAAEEELKGTGYQLMKLKVAGTPTIAEWLGQALNDEEGPEVGFDGWVASYADVAALIDDLRRQGGITVRTSLDPLAQLWADRPTLPADKVYRQPLNYAGESCKDKLARIRKALRERHADGMLMASLDDIAWTLNLRGADVHCNPFFVSYLLLDTDKATLFINPEKLTADVAAYLQQEGVNTRDYAQVGMGLKDYFEYNILLDPHEINYTLYQIAADRHKIVSEPSPVKAMKAVKNETEIAGFHDAMLKDGIAMVKFLRWLKPAVKAGGVTEMTVDRQLTALRAAQPLYKENSFDTIAAYQEHGAIVHYEASADTDVALRPEGLILIDSGAQYQDGTTDITRTIALGPVTEEQRQVYTLVMKGHIQLQMLQFPDGASGTQLDAIARKDLWHEGLNFMHGTGHGVGAFLGVHEGPHQIRQEYIPAPLHAGMTVTDEPGIYLAGRFGVRIENTLLITPYRETEFGAFLQFEPLTLCPYDTAPLDTTLLTGEETNWLNAYHQRVFDLLAPHLDDEERAWLRTATEAI